MSLLEIPIPADATVPEALKAVNRELGSYARKHKIVGGDKDGRRFPRTHLVRLEPTSIVYEVEDDCDAAISRQDVSCCVSGSEMMNRPRSYLKCGYEADTRL